MTSGVRRMTEQGVRWANRVLIAAHNERHTDNLDESMQLLNETGKNTAEFWLRAFIAEVKKRAEAVDAKRRQARICTAFDCLTRELIGDER